MIALFSGLAVAGRPAPLPGPLPALPATAPTVVRRSLSNGLPVVVVPDPEVPLFEVRLVFRVGEPSDPPGLEGLCSLTFDLLDEGAGRLDAGQLATALRTLGAQLSTSCSGDGASIEISGLARNLGPALDLFSDVVRSPRLAEADLAIVRARQIQRVKLSLQRPDGVADRAQAALQYGDRYVGRSPTAASLEAISIGAVHGAWSKSFGPSVAAVFAGGDVDPDALVALLEARLAGWNPPTEPVAVDPTPRDDTAGRLYAVDLPGAAQSAVRAWVPVVEATHVDRFPLEVGVEALGGAFSSRLNLNLREDKGWTYGARCNGVWRDGPGMLACATLVRADATGGTVTEVRRELADLGEARPIGPAESDDSRGSMLRTWPLQHETNGSVLTEQVRIWRRNLPADWPERWLAAIGAVDGTDAADATRRAADLARTTFLVVGDLEKIRADLQASGLPVVELPRE